MIKINISPVLNSIKTSIRNFIQRVLKRIRGQ
jgi:hypothetical protein